MFAALLNRSGVLDAAKELEKLGKREADAAAKVSPLHSSSGVSMFSARLSRARCACPAQGLLVAY